MAHGISKRTQIMFSMSLFFSPINGRQDRESRDLRGRLDRMRSPSGRRDAGARHHSRGDRDNPPSTRQRIKQWENKQLDSHGETAEGQIRDRRRGSSDKKILMDDQLREIQSEIKMLDRDKRELEVYMADMIHEADALTSKVQELEVQLSKEHEDRKRITTKVKKFIKAHNHHLHLQDELKRSHAELWKLGELLDSDDAGFNENNDMPITNEAVAEASAGAANPTYDKSNYSPGKKRPRALLEARETSIRDNPANGENNETGKMKLDSSRSYRRSNQWGNGEQSAFSDGHPIREKSRERNKLRYDFALTSQNKVSKTSSIRPSTGIAACEMDEEVEISQGDERAHEIGAKELSGLAFLPPPPPPIPKNAYSQYKGDDEVEVDIDGNAEEMVEVDIV